ncbi:MAG TPA: NAD(P)H-dependent oxidoreductase subunit E, partial [Ilumatobacteraceae bacterium]|nr:NAD(P)H-dependent oxidoreductase subunit E [Ilumatobacteraceae bacterium]
MSANDVTHRSQGHTTDPAIEAIIGDHAGWAGGLMPALHAVQHHAGFIDRGYIPLLAHTFNLSVAEVHGVISFYKDFRTVAPKGPVVQVCRAEACIARGGKAVEARALELGATEAVEIEEVFCLGLCAQGPAMASSGRVFGNVDAAGVETIIGDAIRRAGAPSVVDNRVDADDHSLND